MNGDRKKDFFSEAFDPVINHRSIPEAATVTECESCAESGSI